MRVSIESESFTLGRGQSIGLHDRRGARLQVVQGRLWITQEGDRRDLFVDQGERFEIERDGITVLHALRPAQVQVREAHAQVANSGPWWRSLLRHVMRRFVEFGMHRAVTSRVYRL